MPVGQQAILVDFGLPFLKYWRDDNKTAANDRSDAAGGRETREIETDSSPAGLTASDHF